MERLLWHRLAIVLLILAVVAACGPNQPVVPAPAVPPPTQAATPKPTVRATPVAAPPPTSAVLSMGTGSVEFHAANSSEWTAAKDGQSVGPGDFVRTGADGLAGLTFADGSVITLLPSAGVQYNFLHLDKTGGAIAQRIGRVTLLNGDIAFDVVKAPSPPSVFEIATQSEIVAIKGTKGVVGLVPTDDNVPPKGGTFELALLEGKVGVAQVANGPVGSALQLRLLDVEAGKSLALPTEIAQSDAKLRAEQGSQVGAGSSTSRNALLDAARLVFLGGDQAFDRIQTSGGINAGVQVALQSLSATPDRQTAFQKIVSAGYFPTVEPANRMPANEAAASGAFKTGINSVSGNPSAAAGPAGFADANTAMGKVSADRGMAQGGPSPTPAPAGLAEATTAMGEVSTDRGLATGGASPTAGPDSLPRYAFKEPRVNTDGRASETAPSVPSGPSPIAGPAGLTFNFDKIKWDDYGQVRAYKLNEVMITALSAPLPGATPPAARGRSWIELSDFSLYVDDAFETTAAIFGRIIVRPHGASSLGLDSFFDIFTELSTKGRGGNPAAGSDAGSDIGVRKTNISADVLTQFDLLSRVARGEGSAVADEVAQRSATGRTATPQAERRLTSDPNAACGDAAIGSDPNAGCGDAAAQKPTAPSPIAVQTAVPQLVDPTSTPIPLPPTATSVPPTSTSTPSPTATSTPTPPPTATPVPPTSTSTPSPTPTPVPPTSTSTPSPTPTSTPNATGPRK